MAHGRGAHTSLSSISISLALALLWMQIPLATDKHVRTRNEVTAGLHHGMSPAKRPTAPYRKMAEEGETEDIPVLLERLTEIQSRETNRMAPRFTQGAVRLMR